MLYTPAVLAKYIKSPNGAHGSSARAKEYDFMKSDEPYKFDWTTKCRRNLGIKFVNKEFSSRLLHFGVKGIREVKLEQPHGKVFSILVFR